MSSIQFCEASDAAIQNCLNKGTCIINLLNDDTKILSCKCASEYEGKQCETIILDPMFSADQTNEKINYKTPIIVGSIIGITIFTIIVVLIILLVNRKRKNNKAIDSIQESFQNSSTNDEAYYNYNQKEIKITDEKIQINWSALNPHIPLSSTGNTNLAYSTFSINDTSDKSEVIMKQEKDQLSTE